MSKTVKLSVEVSPTLAMQILELIAGGALPTTTVVNNVGESGSGPEPTVDEAAAKEVADEEEQADEEPEEDPEEAEEASEEESEDAEEEPEEEESADDEEPEADDEEGEEESDEGDAPEYTLDDIRAELGKFMKSYKTQAAGKKALGGILAGLPTPAKCLSDVEESEYGDLMAAISGDDDPLA